MRIFAAALLALAAFSVAASPAEARRLRTVAVHPDCNILWPCAGVEPSPRGVWLSNRANFGGPVLRYSPDRPRKAARIARAPRRQASAAARPRTSREAPGVVRQLAEKAGEIGEGFARPARFIAGRLICAINVGSALAERGIKGTGSALALSYLKWGRSAGGPVPGAVIVSRHRGGGHVAIVSRVRNGVVYAWNATGGRSGWREIPYRLAVLDYRVP